MTKTCTQPKLGLLKRLRRNNRGVAMIEMAFTLPTLVFAGLAGLELANLMITHTRISGIALTVADNASRMAPSTGLLALPQVRESDINDVFTGAQLQSGGIDIANNGRIVMSSLQVSRNGRQYIAWQRCFGNRNYQSKYGQAGAGLHGPNIDGMGQDGSEARAQPGIPVMFAEIFYDYEPFIFESWIGRPVVQYDAAFSTRDQRDQSAVFNPNGQARRGCGQADSVDDT